MSFNLEILKDIGIDIKEGIEYTGGEDKYLSALQRFHKCSSDNKRKINEFLNNEDLDNLAITVHALKSNSKMIGDSSLGYKFEILEIASKNNDLKTVKENISEALEEYDNLLTVLEPLGSEPLLKAEGEIDAETARITAEKLLEALDDFDDDTALKLADELSGYPFRITQRNMLRDAKEKISDFLYDEAAELIKEIYPSIE